MMMILIKRITLVSEMLVVSLRPEAIQIEEDWVDFP